jgi:hypothetical protein
MIRYCSILLILILSAASVVAEEQVSGEISGAWITPKEGPIIEAMVYAFNAASGPPPLPEQYWRVPFDIGFTDVKGNFSMKVAVGTYYLGTLKKAAGNKPGPPEDGDLFFFSRDEKGVPKKYTVSSGNPLDVGVFRESAQFKVPAVKITDGITAITGIVKEPDGAPVAGVMVFAYHEPEMTGRPLFVSFRTGKDGKYLLQLSEKGVYYLKSRNFYGGGRPSSGDIFGKYGGETPIPVNVNNKAVTKGIDITVERFVDKRPQ